MWVEKNGKTYRIRDQVGENKVTIESGYLTKTAAKKAINRFETEKLDGELISREGGKELVANVAREWWDSIKVGLKPNTVRTEGGRLEAHIIADLGELTLDELTPSAVQAWINDMAKELAPKTVANCHGQLYSLMDWAVYERKIRGNPCARTTLPELVDHEMRFLTEKEAAHLVACTPEKYRDIVQTFLGTGMRWGELAGLQVRRFDRFTRSLLVMESLVDRGLILGTTKSRASRRSMSVARQTYDALWARCRGKEPLDWIFRQPRGGPLRHGYFYTKVWQPTCEKAGLKGLRVHDLRHTHAAWLISAGVPLTAVQRRLGHKSIAVTSDRYGHLLPEVDDDIVLVIERSLAGEKRRGNLGEPAGSQVSTDVQPGTQKPGQAA